MYLCALSFIIVFFCLFVVFFFQRQARQMPHYSADYSRYLPCQTDRRVGRYLRGRKEDLPLRGRVHVLFPWQFRVFSLVSTCCLLINSVVRLNIFVSVSIISRDIHCRSNLSIKISLVCSLEMNVHFPLFPKSPGKPLVKLKCLA